MNDVCLCARVGRSESDMSETTQPSMERDSGMAWHGLAWAEGKHLMQQMKVSGLVTHLHSAPRAFSSAGRSETYNAAETRCWSRLTGRATDAVRDRPEGVSVDWSWSWS